MRGDRPGGAPEDRSARRPRLRAGRRHSLRGRAALSFAAVALVLAAAMALAVWGTAWGFLVDLRERSAATQAAANADQLHRLLALDRADANGALDQLPREMGAASLLLQEGQWFTTSLDVGRADIPGPLLEAVLDGQPSRQRIVLDGRTMLAVGVPLPGGDAYFAVFPLEELSSTLRVLATVLAVALAVVAPVALVLGWWVTRPALRPLARLSDAAAAIASGDVTTRIDPHGDPELAPIAASFNTTAAALERRVRADARFATDVAHELRSPLTTMVTAFSLVDADRDRLSQDGKEALDLLRAEVERFTRLVQDLLEISRADAGNADLAAVDVRLAELVEWALPVRLRRRLVVEASAAQVHVRADKRRLERVIANLVDNAEQHGGGLTAVTVSCDDGLAHVSVDDSGPGVRESDRERIFERFTRGPATGRLETRGVGLGLALVVGHLRLLGGRITVEDSPHGGARFVISLPVEEDR